MPHAIVETSTHLPLNTKSHTKSHTKKSSPNRAVSIVLDQLFAHQALYYASPLSQTLTTRLRTVQKTSPVPITGILSLGLGSLFETKGQTRRLKQLAIFLGLRDTLQHLSSTRIQLFAQDPSFSRHDEALLSSLDIQIVRTPEASQLGEAEAVLGPQTIVYAPFLTLDAYGSLLVGARKPVPYLLGDDFEALETKWPRYSAERAQVEEVMHRGLARYRRRKVEVHGFWEEEDRSFPMAWYELAGKKGVEVRGKL
ncbi:uncharacterized protein yc1106_06268 [Curvularia clavata]|uniref:SRR1-like domain-containing protein n=1 Tax=Curvularia clavata TaxID=95742 RepID=A0A9Q8ZCM4_CURCL|nr:uncharacterized protein yc1106_06268 [Curvularia clavata]